jgi:hypothetical protein
VRGDLGKGRDHGKAPWIDWLDGGDLAGPDRPSRPDSCDRGLDQSNELI